jgi:hypothetical protein
LWRTSTDDVEHASTARALSAPRRACHDQTGMERLIGRVVFSAGSAHYRWEDVLLASRTSAEWDALLRRARDGIACSRRVDAGGDPPAAREIEATGDRWRYERQLLSADETEMWLRQRQLTFGDWHEYIGRVVLRRRWPSAGRDAQPRVTDADVAAFLYVEAVCSGTLQDLAERLAGHAAVHDQLTATLNGPPPWCADARVGTIADGLLAAGDGEGDGAAPPSVHSRTRALQLACVARSFEHAISAIADRAAVARELATNPLDWTRFTYDAVTFRDEDAANEAALVVRADHRTLDDVARLADRPLVRHQTVLEDADGDLGPLLPAAQPGDLLGPVPTGGSYAVVAVRERDEPTVDDSAARQRAHDRLVRRLVQRAIGERIRWHERL